MIDKKQPFFEARLSFEALLDRFSKTASHSDSQ